MEDDTSMLAGLGQEMMWQRQEALRLGVDVFKELSNLHTQGSNHATETTLAIARRFEEYILGLQARNDGASEQWKM